MSDGGAIAFRRDVPRASPASTGSSTGFSMVALKSPSCFARGDIVVGDGRHYD
jgi:hypothetical protein